MSIVENRTAGANANQQPDVELADQIAEQLGTRFRRTDDGLLRGGCPSCEEENGLYIDRLTGDEFGYSCSTCGISGFTVENLVEEVDASRPECSDDDWTAEVDPERIQTLKELAADRFHSNLTECGNEIRFEQDDGWIGGHRVSRGQAGALARNIESVSRWRVTVRHARSRHREWIFLH